MLINKFVQRKKKKKEKKKKQFGTRDYFKKLKKKSLQ